MNRDAERRRYAAGLGLIAAVGLSSIGFSTPNALPFIYRLAIGVAVGAVAAAAIYFAIVGLGRKD